MGADFCRDVYAGLRTNFIGIPLLMYLRNLRDFKE